MDDRCARFPHLSVPHVVVAPRFVAELSELQAHVSFIVGVDASGQQRSMWAGSSFLLQWL